MFSWSSYSKQRKPLCNSCHMLMHWSQKLTTLKWIEFDRSQVAHKCRGSRQFVLSGLLSEVLRHAMYSVSSTAWSLLSQSAYSMCIHLGIVIMVNQLLFLIHSYYFFVTNVIFLLIISIFVACLMVFYVCNNSVVQLCKVLLLNDLLLLLLLL